MTFPRDKSFLWLFSAFILAEIIFLIATSYISYFVPIILIGLVFVIITFIYPSAGICAVIILHYFTLRQTETIDIFEIFYALYFFSFFGWWFLRSFLIEKSFFIKNTVEYALVIFFGTCLLSIVPAVLFGAEPMKWFRELIPFTILLLYFPVRDCVNTPKKTAAVFFSLFLLCSTISINNIINYKQHVMQAAYQWQFQSFRQSAGEPLTMFMVLLFLGLFMYAPLKRYKAAFLGLMIVFIVALGISFSRGYWLGAAIGGMIMFLLMDIGKKLRLTVYTGLITAVTIGVLYIFMGDVLVFVFTAVASRFASVGHVGRDLSMLNRLSEYTGVWNMIILNPVAGYGLGSTFTYYNLILSTHLTSWYTHNGYLYILFKLGLPGVLSFFAFYLTMTIRCVKRFYAEQSEPLKGLYIAACGMLITMLPLSFTSPQFIQKDSLLIMTLVFGVVNGMRKNTGNRIS